MMNLRLLRNVFKYSVSDPYYILGVEKSASFPEIKKAYYKLAAQYHPDINKTSSAEAQFIQIKQAFERVKQLKGEAVQMNSDGQTIKDQEYESIRKDHKDYNEDWNNQQQDGQDFNNFYYQSQGLQGQEYDNLRKSFTNLHELNDKRFKPINMKMPNTEKRFNLGQVMYLKVFSDGSNFYIILVSIGMFIVFIALNGFFYNRVQLKHENMLYGMLNKHTIKEQLDDEELLENINYKLQNSVEYQRYQKEEQNYKEHHNEQRRKLVPMLKSYSNQSEFDDCAL